MGGPGPGYTAKARIRLLGLLPPPSSFCDSSLPLIHECRCGVENAWDPGVGAGKGETRPSLQEKNIFSGQPCLGTELHLFSCTGDATLQPEGLQPAHQLPQGVSVKASHGDIHNPNLPPQRGPRRSGVPTHHQQPALEALHQGLPRWAGRACSKGPMREGLQG